MTNEKEHIEYQIKRLQDNLLSIRKIAGWTAEELGDRIGVTKQTISNLENGKAKLTQTQYIAIRAVLEYEMLTNKENVVLPQVMKILLDNENDGVIDEKKEADMKAAIETVAATAAGGIVGTQLSIVAGAVLIPFLGPIGIVGGLVGGAMFQWLNPIMKKKNRKKSNK